MTMKKRFASIFFAVALVMGLVPSMAFAAPDPIATDVVIHKLNVPTGTQLQDHDGTDKGITGGVSGASALPNVAFSYWKISDAATEAQINEMKTLTTLDSINTWIAANPGLLTNKVDAGKTNTDGKLTVAGLAEGKYFFAETNGPEVNVEGYIGVPFVLELPIMKVDGSGYFGTGANALHVYPKNVANNPGLDVETVDAKTKARIGTATFEVWKDGTKIDTININEVTTLTQLASGSYQLINTVAPSGYIVDNRPVKFTVSAGNVTFDTPNSPMASFNGAAVPNPMITIQFVKNPDVGKTEGSGGSEQIGKTVTWTITAEIPANIKEYQTFKITDKLDSRLDFSGLNTVQVSVSNGTMTENTHYTKAYNDAQHAIPHALVVDFVPTELESLAGQTITITFDTTINSSAIIGTPIPNEFELEFDNGHGGSGTLKPPVPPSVWTGGKKFIKVALNEDGAPLKDAEFKVATDAQGTQFLKWTTELIEANTKAGIGLTFGTPTVGQDIVMISGDPDGLFGIMGLKGGTYYLVETKAPIVNGKPYNLLREPVQFEITKTSHEDTAIMKIVNKTGLQIPQTGGVGTVLFTVVGIALMVLAIAMFRRKKAEQSSKE